MKKTVLSLAVATLVLTGCATGSAMREKITGKQFDEPVVEKNEYLSKQDNAIPPPSGGPIPVAVYAFRDMTGQRKSVANIASLSSAVTQGGDAYLIKALQDVGDQRWFTVLERVGLENLIKERQMIRQMREQYQGKDAKPLPPMMFAGIIIEGAIVGYDSNTLTGGSGVRLLGIGATTQYQSDTVTVTLRTVSVSTGEVLTSVTVTKTVLSYMDKFGVLKFVSSGEQAVEAEIGASINESINKATNLAIQAAVVGTIREGARKGHWNFKEERKNELVQPQTPPQRAPEAAPAAEQSSKPESVREVKAAEPKVEDKPAPEKQTPVVVAPPAIESKTSGVLPAETKVYKANVRTAVRSEPDQKSKLADVILPGRQVSIVEEKSGWLLVSLNGKTLGWVWKELLQEAKGSK
jgi:curli production assembly/transport component CsgG